MPNKIAYLAIGFIYYKMGRRIILIFILLTMHILAFAQSSPFPADNLQLWLRADSVGLTDGRVSRWFDLSTNQYEIVQTNASAMPSVVGGVLNDNPVLDFRLQDFLLGGNILDLGVDSWTWFVVGKTVSDGAIASKNVYTSSPGRWLLCSNTVITHTSVGVTDGKVDFPSNADFDITTWENNRSAKENLLLRNNKLLKQSNLSAPNFSLEYNCNFVIGGYENPAYSGTLYNERRFEGQIAEIIAFNTVDSALRHRVTEYLANKYFPERNASVGLGVDIRMLYGFADTAITTAYNSNFVSYLWSTGETDSVIHVNKSGKYWVTVTNPFGLVSSDTINVFYPEVTQIRDTTICAGDTITWNTNLDGSYSFLWSDGSTGRSLEISKAGGYWVEITDTLGFKWHSDIITVNVDDYPQTTLFGGLLDGHTIDTAFCSGNSLGLATNADVTTSYRWNTGASSARIALTQSDDYTLVSTNARGCQATNTAHVTIKGEAPQIGFDINGLCFGDTTVFTGLASSEQGIESYLWIIDRTDSVSGQAFKHRFAEAGRHEAKIVFTSNNTCANDSSFTINIREIPHPDFSYTPVCAGVPVDLLGTSRIPDTCAVAQYEWLSDGVALGTDENLSFTFGDSMPVTYSLTLDNGCANDTTIFVSVKDEYATPRYVSCVSPAYGALVAGESIGFLWNPDNDILYYELITSSDKGFTVADTVICYDNSVVMPAASFSDTTYWKVIAFNHCMVSMESNAYMFRKTESSGAAFAADVSLQLWLRADSVELTDGRVSRWFDLSPNQYEIVQTNASAMPSVVGGVLNDNPVLDFRLQDFLLGGNILDLGVDSWTWFVVGKTVSDGAIASKNVYTSSPGRWLLCSNTVITHTSVGVTDGKVDFPSNADFDITTWENNRSAKENLLLRNNKLLKQSNLSAPNFSLEYNCNFVIGGYENPAYSGTLYNERRFEGQIAEIIAFNTVDSALRHRVTEYLANKYFPERNASVGLGVDIRMLYGFADTAITTAYNSNFVSYLWSTGETDSVIHVNKSGKYWVTVTNPFGLVSSDTINVFYPEVTQIRDTTICAGDTITWNTNLDGSYSFLWSDGSTGRSLEITKAGNYWVEIADTLGFKWHSDTLMVEVDSFPVTARLEGDQIISCIGNNIYLQTGFEEAVSYLWSNGSTADHLEVTEAGQYWVKMADNLGCKAADTAYISILGIAPTPDFTHSALCATREISFRDNSRASGSSQITSHLWQFGDGGTSTAINPEHSYARSGSYNLVLTIASDNGCSNQKRQKIVIDSLPKADFIPVRACSHTDVQFTDMSSTPVNYIADWQWTMNDTVFAERHPSTVFASQGDMPVQLIVTTAHGCTDTLRRTINIMQGPDVEFTFSAPCVNTPIYFTNSTSSILGLSTSYTWTADETVFSQQRSPMIEYADTGTHIISLSVKQLANGCSATVSKTVSVKNNPKPDIDADSFCAGKASSLRAINREQHSPSGEWLWSIDSLPEMQGQTISPVFAKSGRHKARLTIIDGNGCTAFYDTVINVRATPTAAFSARSARGPVPFEAEFVNTSRNANHYLWSFGDGRTSTETDVCHTYNIDGEYTVSLEASNGNCADTAVRIVSAIVPEMNIRMLSATAETNNGIISIEAVIANLSNFDITDIGIAWRDNLGHVVSEVSADTVKQNKILRYKFKAAIGELNPERLQYICVEVQPGAAFADDDPDDNEYCIILNNSEFTACLPKPNPADKELNISYIMPEDGNVRVELFNSRGIVAAVLYDGPASAGFNSLNVDVQRFKPGMYVYKITYGETSKTQPVLISR